MAITVVYALINVALFLFYVLGPSPVPVTPETK
jgi:hypothetical protein